MAGGDAVPFESPPELEVDFHLSTLRRTVWGMDVPQGVSPIVGGGFHRESTLLEALQSGCCDKVPGGGRKFVVSVGEAVKIRAEGTSWK